jgi:hypothetical protein
MIVTESDPRRPLQAAAYRIWRRPPATPGQGGPSGIARGEAAQVLTVASGRSADRSRATATGRRPSGGRWPCRAGRRGLPGGASSPARQGVTDTPRSLRIFADHLSETAQVMDAGQLTCAGAAGSPSWLRSAGVRWAFGYRGAWVEQASVTGWRSKTFLRGRLRGGVRLPRPERRGEDDHGVHGAAA